MLTLKERPRRSSQAMSDDPITLIVSLDRSGSASSGDLYLDDGRSYAFQRGQYAYRSFTFTSKQGEAPILTSSTASVPDHAGLVASSSDYASNVVIDRIVVLGLTDGPQGWSVVDSGGRVLDAAPGPLFLKPGLPEVALVVRKAGLAAHGDWSLKFVREKGSLGASVS